MGRDNSRRAQFTYNWALLKVLLLAVVVAVGLHVLLGPAAATPTATTTPQNVSSVAPYYANSSASVDNASWMAGRHNATLDNVVNYATRIGAYIIGSGYTAQDGVGAAGTLVLGLLVGGVFVGRGERTGPVGGAVLAVTVIAGLVSATIAPGWFWAIALFGLGTVLSVVVIRALE